jgi:hypothetical protein
MRIRPCRRERPGWIPARARRRPGRGRRGRGRPPPSRDGRSPADRPRPRVPPGPLAGGGLLNTCIRVLLEINGSRTAR